LSVGYAKRVAGPSSADNHIFTMGVGLELPVLFRLHPRGTGGTDTASSARAAAPLPLPAPWPPGTSTRPAWRRTWTTRRTPHIVKALC